MDSEISKIWEEALRYASPLPIPPSDPACHSSPSETNTNVNEHDVTIDNATKSVDTAGITSIETLLVRGNTDHTGAHVNTSNIDANNQSQPDSSSANRITKIAGRKETIDNRARHVENTGTNYTKSDDVTADNRHVTDPTLTTHAAVESMINLLSIPNSARIARPSAAVGNILRNSPSIETIHTSLQAVNSPNTSESSLKDSLLGLPSLSVDSRKDVSDALAAGLKMIQQGNELIARALKLSNSASEMDSSPSFTNLEPLSLSMPSSVESVNIPSETIAADGENTEKHYNTVILQFGDSPKPVPNEAVRLINEEQAVMFDSDNSSRDASPLEPKPKRRRRREKNMDPSPAVPVLPPCKICDEKSSGFHYGANTCEACKGFFRRTLKKKEVIFQCKCSDNEKLAWQQGPYKNGCPACRYARCLKVGMSKSAIKIGRYTLNRKTENIREVKSLEAMDSVIEKAILSSMNVTGSPSSVDSPAFGSVLSSPEGLMVRDASPMTDVSPAPLSDPPSCSTSMDDAVTPSPKQPPLSVTEIDDIIQKVTEAHLSKSLLEEDLLNRPKDVIDKRHRKYLEDYNLKEAVFGHMKPLSKAEYKEFYNATGIDIDGRQAALEEALQHFTKKIVQFVEYAKAIPGFNDLSTKDQASLIKYSRPEHLLMAGYQGILKNANLDLQVCTTPWGKEIHLQDIGRIIPKDFLELKFDFCKRLLSLGLTTKEEAILRAIVVTSPDRCDLDDPEAVQGIQLKLIACLEHLVGLRPDNGKKTLYKIFDLLVKFRDFSEREFKETKELVFDWPLISSYRYSLMRDIFM